MRKVSFSAAPVTVNSNLDNHCPDLNNLAPLSVIEQDINDDEPLHLIEVREIDRKEEEQCTWPADILPNSELFEVKLGMLKQGTIYSVEFTLPTKLGHGEFDLTRSMIDISGKVSLPVNVGASFKLISCIPRSDLQKGKHVISTYCHVYFLFN